MRVYLYRHALTRANEERRYLGRTDEPLSEKGRAMLLNRTGLPEAKCVYASPMRRCMESAEILFPNARIICVPGLAEMDFGDFEMRTADEMKDDDAYAEWVNGMCEGKCPGGEDKKTFSLRTEKAFREVLEMAGSEDPIVIVAHGGTVMALMERFGVPQKSYWQWHVPAGGCISARLERGTDIRLIAEDRTV